MGSTRKLKLFLLIILLTSIDRLTIQAQEIDKVDSISEQKDTIQTIIKRIGASFGVGGYHLEIHSPKFDLTKEFGIYYRVDRPNFGINVYGNFNQHTIKDRGRHQMFSRQTGKEITVNGTISNRHTFFDFGIESNFRLNSIDNWSPYIHLGFKGIFNTSEYEKGEFTEQENNFNSKEGSNYGSGLGVSTGVGALTNLPDSWALDIKLDYSRNITDININPGKRFRRILIRATAFKTIGTSTIKKDRSSTYSNNRYGINSKKRNRSPFTKVNSFYFELGGPGIIYSLNYERRFPFSKNQINTGIAVSGGLSYLPIDNSAVITYSIPLQLSFVYQYFRNRFDIGLASTVHNVDGDNAIDQFIVTRYSRLFRNNDNLEWGIIFSPVYRYQGEFEYHPWAGVRIGYKLNNKK